MKTDGLACERERDSQEIWGGVENEKTRRYAYNTRIKMRRNTPKMKIRGWRRERKMLNLMRISQQNKKAIPDPRASRLENHLKNMAEEKQSHEGDGVDEETRTEAVSLRTTEEKKPERRRQRGASGM